MDVAAPASTQAVCPQCGHEFTTGGRPVRKARMAWSDKRGHFVRVEMTDAEYGQYLRRGSVD